VDNASPVDGAGAPRGRAGGFSDWLPGPAARRRAVSDAFLNAFEAWGYGLVATPVVEPLDTVAAGISANAQTSLFRFMDADGRLLALVGERTVSVARVVATQLREGPFPLRLCYAGPVLRNQALLGGRRRESLQAGCELVGSATLAADAECVALAASSLENAGLTGVQIDVGHADFLPGLLEGAGLDDATRERVLQALQDRDLVAVEEALEGTEVGDAERSLLLRFPALRGGREILDVAAQGLRAERPLRALDELRRLWDLLAEHGLNGGVLHLDLGAVRDWDYYTGPTFELFTRDLGFPLGSGGRYDQLLARFGFPLPATGFVISVDRCCDALLRRADAANFANQAPVRIGYAPGTGHAAVALAQQLRDRGLPVATDLDASEQPAAGVLVYIDHNGAVRWQRGATWSSGTSADAIEALTGKAQPAVLERRGA
jgi:ATP phosphoribosyltransferase regulatory subunit